MLFCSAHVRLAAILLTAGTAHAQLIRADSATTTSAFSAGFAAANTINGSGLPANFTLTDQHADYANGNHWTTNTGRTLGESITWTFNTAQTLGGIHIWNHRSNSIANNPFYEIVRFDLILFDGANGAGSTLATFTDVPLQPNIAVAETIPFTVTANVRSARLVVRETQNNNFSAFTGLAEVAFAPCLPITPGAPIASTSICRTGSITMTARPGGSGQASYVWQWRDLGATTWVTITDGPNFGDNPGEAAFDATGATTNAITFSLVTGSPRKEVRALLTNPCGTAESNIAFLDLEQCDCIDFNNNGVFPEDQDVIDFLNVLAGGDCGACSDIDFNNNGVFPEDQDVIDFFATLAGSACG
ncbi:MAG TPA: hypothetical protein VK157_00945 [Phycisphaerales bacterium]|nr:hypothetical protein [Phycisphaerales bacterium]